MQRWFYLKANTKVAEMNYVKSIQHEQTTNDTGERFAQWAFKNAAARHETCWIVARLRNHYFEDNRNTMQKKDAQGILWKRQREREREREREGDGIATMFKTFVNIEMASRSK